MTTSLEHDPVEQPAIVRQGVQPKCLERGFEPPGCDRHSAVRTDRLTGDKHLRRLPKFQFIMVTSPQELFGEDASGRIERDVLVKNLLLGISRNSDLEASPMVHDVNMTRLSILPRLNTKPQETLNTRPRLRSHFDVRALSSRANSSPDLRDSGSRRRDDLLCWRRRRNSRTHRRHRRSSHRHRRHPIRGRSRTASAIKPPTPTHPQRTSDEVLRAR